MTTKRLLSAITLKNVLSFRELKSFCRAVEFPVSVSKSTRKPHYMTASEQAKIEFAAPSYLRNIVVILVETAFATRRNSFP